MRIFILGATGGSGKELTTQALARGHNVTVMVRSPHKMTTHPRLTVIAGDPRNAGEIAVAGQDVVLSALGTAREPTTLLGDCARSTIEAMQRDQVRRLLVISSALLFPDIGFIGRIVRLFFKYNLRDSAIMEKEVAQSGLDWTVVRPPRLTNGPRTDKYRISKHAPRPSGMITRADLAFGMLDIAEAKTHIGEVIGISK